MLLFLAIFLVAAPVVGVAAFIAKAGIWWCEETRWLQFLLGGFFAFYALAALALGAILPAVPDDRVDVASLTGFWGDVALAAVSPAAGILAAFRDALAPRGSL